MALDENGGKGTEGLEGIGLENRESEGSFDGVWSSDIAKPGFFLAAVRQILGVYAVEVKEFEDLRNGAFRAVLKFERMEGMKKASLDFQGEGFNLLLDEGAMELQLWFDALELEKKLRAHTAGAVNAILAVIKDGAPSC